MHLDLFLSTVMRRIHLCKVRGGNEDTSSREIRFQGNFVASRIVISILLSVRFSQLAIVFSVHRIECSIKWNAERNLADITKLKFAL